MTPSVPIRSVPDLLDAIPYLLGYHPDDGVALVGLLGGDLHFVVCSGQPRLAARLFREHGATEAFVVGYGADVPEAVAVADQLRLLGVPVLDELRVHEGHYWSRREPLRRHRLTRSSVAAATAAFHGMRALPSRADLVAELAPVTGAERVAMGAATRRAEARMLALDQRERGEERFARLVRRAGAASVRAAERRHRADGRISDDAAAWLSVLLVSPAVFAYAWERLTDDLQGLWTDVVRRSDPEYVCAPACLLGYLTWRTGQGTIARIVLERALSVDPEHEMARLLDQVVQRAKPPVAARRAA